MMFNESTNWRTQLDDFDAPQSFDQTCLAISPKPALERLLTSQRA